MKSLVAILFLTLLAIGNANAFFIGGGPSGNPLVTLPSANLQAIYSMIQYNGWGSNCLRVQRSSDNTQMDIGFVNGVCDIATAMTFAGGGGLNVVTWYDQSGNGYDATQATIADAPVFTSATEVAGIPNIVFWNNSANLSIASGLATNTQAETVFSVQAMTAASQGVWEVNTAYSSGNALLASTAGDQILNNVAFQSTGRYMHSNPAVSVMVSGSSSKTYQVNSELSTGITATGSFTTAGGNIGSLGVSGYPFYGQVYMVAIYSTALSAGAASANLPNLYSSFRIATSPVGRIIYDGDSITEGYQSTNGVNNPFQAYPQINAIVTYRDIGIFGQTLATMLSNETVNIVNSYDSSLTYNVVVDAGGEADICNNSASAASVEADMESYVANAKAAGYSAIVATLIYDNNCTPGSTNDNSRIAYNTFVKANAATYGYSVVDYDSIPQLQFPQTAGYSADGVHPTTAGYALMAAKAATAINAVIP